MITEKQKRAISFIENQLELTFKGTTFEDASHFIGSNLKHAQFLACLDHEIEAMGVPVFSAKHRKGDYDEVTLDHRDSVAEVKFKRDITHGVKPATTLINLQENIITDKLSI